MESYNHGDWQESIRSFAEAQRQDTSLLVAGYTQSAFRNLGLIREADSVMRWMEDRRGLATTVEGLWISVFASWRLSPEEEYRATTEVWREESSQVVVFQMMNAAYETNHLAEAIRLYRRRDTTVALSRDFSSWYTYAAGAMHGLARYADELALARDARMRQPAEFRHAEVEARALIGLGRLGDLEQLLTASRSLPWYRAPGQLMHAAGLELWAHGRRNEARAMWERALAWHLGQSAGSPEQGQIRHNIALERYYLGQYAEARSLLAALATESPDDRLLRAAQAFVAARSGDTASALERATDLRAHTAARDTYVARILALLGRKEEAVAALRDYLNRGGRFSLGGFHGVLELDPLRDYPSFVALVALKD